MSTAVKTLEELIVENKYDKIHIRDLHLRCIIGFRDFERLKKQDVLINISLYADLRKACQSDSVKDAVDYKQVKNCIVSMVEESQFFLLEKLAEEIAKLCLNFDLVQKVHVTVDKPGALRFARSVALEISREKTDS